MEANSLHQLHIIVILQRPHTHHSAPHTHYEQGHKIPEQFNQIPLLTDPKYSTFEIQHITGAEDALTAVSEWSLINHFIKLINQLIVLGSLTEIPAQEVAENHLELINS